MILKKEVILTTLVFIFLIGVFSATLDCSVTSISKTMEEGGTIPIVNSFSCTNNYNYSVDINKVGSFFTLSESTPITIGSGNTKGTIIVSFNEVLEGIYEGMIYSEGLSIPVNLEVIGQVDPTSCQINPSIISYNQDFQQGAKTTETITFNPYNCQGEISISGASVQGGVFVDDEGVSKRKPVSLGIITSNEININIDTEGLPAKSYDDIKLSFNVYGKKYTIPFVIRVSGSAGGSGSIDINNLPTCSLTNNIINLNESYSLVCTNLVTDVEIVPIVDNDYIEGIGLERESNQISWMFKAKKYGNTIIRAGFYYLGFPVGDFFEQEIKIQAISGQTPGSDLKILFTPKIEDISENEQVILQLIDNKSDSLVENPEIYIDAVKISPLNESEKSFPFKFQSGKNYEIRGKAIGYNDIVQIVNITSKPLDIILTPNQETYFVNDIINISSSINETSILINNEIVTSPYTFISSGNFTIKIVKEGYISVNKTILVKNSVILEWSSCSRPYEDWKKGKSVTCGLSTNSDWEIWLNNTLINNGTGNIIDFEIDDYGLLEIKADGINIGQANIEKKGWFGWLRWNNYWIYAGIVIIGLIGYFMFFKESKDEFEQPLGSNYGEE